MDQEDGGPGLVIDLPGVPVTAVADDVSVELSESYTPSQTENGDSVLDPSFDMSVDTSVDLTSLNGNTLCQNDDDEEEEEEEIDDDEMPMVIDEGPTEKKRVRVEELDPKNSSSEPEREENLRKPFYGFHYNPAVTIVIQSFKGLPSEDVRFDALNRNLLDMHFPPKTLPKLKITISKNGNEQPKVVMRDVEPTPAAELEKISPVPPKAEILSSTMTDSFMSLDESFGESFIKLPLNLTQVSQTTPKVRESREWKPSGQYFKPLNSGWIREVIYDREDNGQYKSKPKEINYYAPCTQTGKQRKFQTLSDLGSFLKSTNSEFSLANFSFRMEPMNATDGQEVIRASDEEPSFLQSKQLVELLPAGSKRRHSSEEAQEVCKDLTRSGEENACGLKVKTFGKLNSPNISNSDLSTPKSKSAMKEREPKTSEKSSLIFKVSKANLSSLSSPKVTITPARKNQLVDSANKVQKSKPSISISPSPKQGTSLPSNIAKRPVSHGSSGVSKINSNPFNSKILRPIKPTTQLCSIHCPRSAFKPPDLTCNGCFSFYHPVCIGLEEQVDYSSYDFYCNVCSPPVEKENNRPRPMVSSAGLTVKSSPTVLITQKPRNATSSPSSESRQAPIEIVKVSSRPNPPRPIESQAVVNIGGVKYLAMAKDKGNTGRNSSVLLQPTGKDGYSPSYEVIESPDGKLILNPIKASNGTTVQSQKVRAPDGCFLTSQIQRVSSDYFYGLLHVFQYLTIAELCKAAQVCKLWNEVAHHKSLWKSASLSMCQVKNWDRFLSVMEEKNVEHIDFKRLVVNKSEENTWMKHLHQNIGKLKNVTHVEFQRIPPEGLENFVNGLYQEKGSRLSNIISLETACHASGELPKALDFATLGNVNHLEQLRINSTSGPLKLTNFGRGLSIFGWKFASSLKVLSVLNTDCLTEEQMSALSELRNLQQLEIGSCHRLSRDFLTNVAKLEKLQSLRLERAVTGDELGVLSSLKNLQNLELIDNEFKPGFDKGFVLLKSVRKTLLIPVYVDETAKINRNLIDALTKMQNITHFYLGFTNEWLGSLDANEPNAKGDTIPFQEDEKVVHVSLPKLSKKLQVALPVAQKVKILKMWKRATTRQTLANRKP